MSSGLADVENNVKATPQTVYRIASISEMITAVALLQLVQSGRLSLNASVRDYVPELPDQGEKISVRHVLAHLSGARHYKNAKEFFNQTHYAKLVDALEPFKNDPLAVKPGERFLYSTWAYTLLGLVIERVSGLAFHDYMNEHVFGPLNMTASTMDDYSAIIQNRARGYTLGRDGGLRNAPFTDLSDRFPGAGMLSTVEDLAGFAMAFLEGNILDASLMQIMTTEHMTTSGMPTGFGLGCFVRELDGRKIFGHAGTTPQASACLLIVPEERLAIIMLANLDKADVLTMSIDVARIMLTDTSIDSQSLPDRSP
jgi:CubicO group peptidase (beta-lactamase class C family)